VSSAGHNKQRSFRLQLFMQTPWGAGDPAECSEKQMQQRSECQVFGEKVRLVLHLAN